MASLSFWFLQTYGSTHSVQPVQDGLHRCHCHQDVSPLVVRLHVRELGKEYLFGSGGVVELDF